jgi:gluconolactonase
MAAGISILTAISIGPCFGQVELTDEAAAKVVIDPGAKVEKLAGGLKFTEGPVWVPALKALVFSDIPASKLMQWQDGKGLTEFRPSEAANGNQVDAQGRIVSCQHAGRNVVRQESDGKLTVLVDALEGKKFHSPNDLAIKSDGTIWFTDPPYGLAGKPKEQDGNWVYRFDPATKKVTVVCREFDMPNGIAFSPDEKRIYIADSGKPARVGAFDVKADGTLGPAVFWLEGGSDGMRVDEKGNLYTTAGDGVRIYNPEGKRIATIKVPEVPANVGFGGEDFKTLFITARTSLYAVKLRIAGNKLQPQKVKQP